MTVSAAAGDIICAAKNSMSEQLASSMAGKQFTSEVNGSIKVQAICEPEEQMSINKILGYTPIYQMDHRVTHDHTVMYVLRQICRDEMHKIISIAPEITTLFIGCSSYELLNPTLFDNAANYFSFSQFEAKDPSRMIPAATKTLLKRLKSRLTRAEKIALSDTVEKDPSKKVMRIKSLQSLLEAVQSGDYTNVPRLGENIRPLVSRIVAFDSTYNWGKKDYIEAFEETGANEMIVMMMIPDELIFPEIPENEIYSIRHFKTVLTMKKRVEWEDIDDDTYTCLGFRYGYSDGYAHKTTNWKTLIDNKVIKGPNYYLNVEIVMSAGIMRVIRLTKNQSCHAIYRQLEVPEYKKYVKVLDIIGSYKVDKTFSKLKYFSVDATNFWTYVVYLVSLDEKSLNPAHAVSWIRRSKSGIKMGGQIYQEKWAIAEEKVIPLAITGLTYAQMNNDQIKKVTENFTEKAKRSNFENLLRGAGWTLAIIGSLGSVIPLRALVDWCMERSLGHKLIVDSKQEKVDFIIPKKIWEEKEKIISEVKLNIENLLDVTEINSGTKFDPQTGYVTALGHDPDCTFCLRVSPRVGKQIIKCDYKTYSYVEWQLSLEQLTAFKTKIKEQADSATCPVHLRDTLLKSIEFIPQNADGIKWKGKINNISAGPGCGKSHIARLIYDEESMVISPYSKLKGDYINQKDINGDLVDMIFKTTHKALEGRGKKNLILDEWTSFDWTALVISAYNNGAETIYLCGDEGQVKIQQDEGEYIGNYVDFNEVTKHTLLVNFRNPQYIVAALNKNFNYNMRATSDLIGRPIFSDIGNSGNAPGKNVMNLSHFGATYNATQLTNTVRSNQGGTFDHVGLIVIDRDKYILKNPDIMRVALSRHKKSLTIYVEEKTEMEQEMRAMLCMDDEDFQNNFKKYANPTFKDYAGDYDEKNMGLTESMRKLCFGIDDSVEIDEKVAEAKKKQIEKKILKEEEALEKLKLTSKPCWFNSAYENDEDLEDSEEEFFRPPSPGTPGTRGRDGKLIPITIDPNFKEKSIKQVRFEDLEEDDDDIIIKPNKPKSKIEEKNVVKRKEKQNVVGPKGDTTEDTKIQKLRSGLKKSKIVLKKNLPSYSFPSNQSCLKRNENTEVLQFENAMNEIIELNNSKENKDQINNKIEKDNQTDFKTTEVQVDACSTNKDRKTNSFDKFIDKYSEVDEETLQNFVPIQWCTANAMEGQISSDLINKFKYNIQTNRDKYVTEGGYITNQAVHRFCRDERINVSYYDKYYKLTVSENYGSKSKDGSVGDLHFVRENDHTSALPKYVLKIKHFSYKGQIIKFEPYKLHEHEIAKTNTPDIIWSWIVDSQVEAIVALDTNYHDKVFSAIDHFLIDATNIPVWIKENLRMNKIEISDELRASWSEIHEIVTRKNEADFFTGTYSLKSLRVMLNTLGIICEIYDKDTLETLNRPKKIDPSKSHMVFPIMWDGHEFGVESPYTPRGKYIHYTCIKNNTECLFKGRLHDVYRQAKLKGFDADAKYLIDQAIARSKNRVTNGYSDYNSDWYFTSIKESFPDDKATGV